MTMKRSSIFPKAPGLELCLMKYTGYSLDGGLVLSAKDAIGVFDNPS